MTPISLEDYARMRLNNENNTCLCVEYASLVLEQAEEIQRLKARLDDLEAEEVLDDLDAILERMDKAVSAINHYTNEIRRIDHAKTGKRI